MMYLHMKGGLKGLLGGLGALGVPGGALGGLGAFLRLEEGAWGV